MPIRGRGPVPLALVLAGCLALRWAFLSSTLLRLDGDEAVTGVMAQRILDGHHLAFFAGQGYMGSGEQYLQAAVLWALPDTTFTLRLVQLGLSVVACAAVYWLTLRVLGERWRALVAAALFAAGPFYNVLWSVKSRGAYLSAMLAGLAGLLAALSVRPGDERLRGRLFLFGLAAGAGFWANWQSAYLLVPAGWWVLGTLRWEAVRRAGWTLAGFCVGAAPTIGHLLLSGSLETSGRHPPSDLADRAEGLVRVAVPQLVGFLDNQPLRPWLSPVWASTAVGAGLAVALFRRRRGFADLLRLRTAERRPIDLLLLCTLVTPVLYLQSRAAVSPYFGYLFPLYGIAPVLLAAALPGHRPDWRRWAAPGLAVAMVVAVLAHTGLMARRHFNYGFGGHPFATGEPVLTERLPAVVDALTEAGAHSVYADYWLAGPLQFLADDRLVVAANYSPRFPALTRAADCDPAPAMVVPAGAPAEALRSAITKAGSRAKETDVEGLTLFTDLEPGLRPQEATGLHEALEPATPARSCPRSAHGHRPLARR